MAERGDLALYSIPAHHAFGDALAQELIARFGDTPLGLARGLVLLPNNRAKRTISDAFVRASGGGLLLPRLVAIGDPEIDEAVGAALDAADEGESLPPAIAPLARRMILARLVSDARARDGQPVDAGEAVRLAGELGRTLDALLVEEVDPARLKAIELAPELSEHWQRAVELFEVVLTAWPKALRAAGAIDLAERRRQLLDRLGQRWGETPPAGFVVAAGIGTAAPAVARLLGRVARLAGGLVVLPGLDLTMDAAEWESLGPHEADPATGRRPRATETHPQFQLKLLLDRMGAAREDVTPWPWPRERVAAAARGRAIAAALAPAAFTDRWTELPVERRALKGVATLECATPNDEAQAIALALREALETPERTAALVTPDRGLARRVAAHLARWGIAAEDSAGRPLSAMPPGTLLLGLVEAAAQRFAPLALLALLKHPLVRSGEDRLAWLEGARALDLALRGPRPGPGLAGITAQLADRSGRERSVRAAAARWWPEAVALLAPIEGLFVGGERPPVELVAAVRETAQALCGDTLWAGPAGRAAASFLGALEIDSALGPTRISPDALGPLLATLLREIAVRPLQGGHPRIAIYGLIEARLQTADLMVLGGLNEGSWPGLPAPDPWLAPSIRATLGLPGLERRIGLAAHDFTGVLGAPTVLLTRARRDAQGPAIASRFWLRLKAMAGEGLASAIELLRWVAAIDEPGSFEPADRPAPCPPAEARPKQISVTEVDRLKADPYAFYARRMLGLAALDTVDADPSAAWRGTAVHAILEAWFNEDDCNPATLRPRVRAMLADPRTHPLLRALWQPRLVEAIDWIAGKIEEGRIEGRSVLRAEQSGRTEIAGVELRGKFDRIDLLAGGGLAIVDYKTGKAPSTAAVRAGFSMQLGLLGVIAERGGFEGLSGHAGAFEYWSLARSKDGFGSVVSPVDPEGKKNAIVTADFTNIAAANFAAAADKWLTGTEPFTAKLVPEYAPYAEYDQLMRRDEWYGGG